MEHIIGLSNGVVYFFKKRSDFIENAPRKKHEHLNGRGDFSFFVLYCWQAIVGLSENVCGSSEHAFLGVEAV